MANWNTLVTYKNISFYMKISKKPILNILNEHLIDYPSPTTINYMWSFGFLSGMCLVIQIVTGVLLAMHYTPNVDLAFYSIEHIMRDVNNGWLIRYFHANGASFFFVVVYSHIARNLYFGSYHKPRILLWYSGIIIFFLMMATAFMGYVLPWGQMSFWGATVITNLFSAIPFAGESLAQWMWGGYSVNNATLNRFFSLHYLLPFAIVGVTIVHLALLHNNSSNNPLGCPSNMDKIPMYPFFIIKDLYSIGLLLLIFAYFVFGYPNSLGHPDNYIEANAMVTPAHIVPEWYFLPFYAILRAIPDKLYGVVAMGLSIAILFIVPFINPSEIRSNKFRNISRIFYWIFILNVFLLGYLGGQLAEEPYITISQISSTYYFTHFFVFINLSHWLERFAFSK